MHGPCCVGEVFVYLGFSIAAFEIDNIIGCKEGAIENLLLLLRHQVNIESSNAQGVCAALGSLCCAALWALFEGVARSAALWVLFQGVARPAARWVLCEGMARSAALWALSEGILHLPY